MAIWRIPTVKAETGYRSDSSIYNAMRAGMLTKSVRIGERSVGWFDQEVKAINSARIAGQSDDQIKALVIRLHSKRSELALS